MNIYLLLINIQRDYFIGGKTPLPGAESAAQRAGEALQCYRDHFRPFLHIQSVNRTDPAQAFYTGTPGIQFHQLVPHFENEPIAFKFKLGGLPIAAIASFMKHANCSKIVACFFGSNAEWKNYARELKQFGFELTLIKDASAFSDYPIEFDSIITLEEFFNTLAASYFQ